ncbi:MAG: AraC family transcriptional regulator [Ruminococcus sp.]|nr:AraC family transcriptional regulator [Ruminococcus sp.]
MDTEKSIQEIAENCGFDDNSYFSKLFKKKYYVTPHEYRLQE